MIRLSAAVDNPGKINFLRWVEPRILPPIQTA